MLLPIDDMAEAKLVLTDALIAEVAPARQGAPSAKRDQEARRANSARDPDQPNDFSRFGATSRHAGHNEGE